MKRRFQCVLSTFLPTLFGFAVVAHAQDWQQRYEAVRNAESYILDAIHKRVEDEAKKPPPKTDEFKSESDFPQPSLIGWE